MTSSRKKAQKDAEKTAGQAEASTSTLGPSPKVLAMVAAGLLCALVLRVAYLVEMRDSILLRILIIDAEFYDTWALKILSGASLSSWTDTAVYYQDPLYAYFLAGIYKIFGRSLTAVRSLQIFLDVTTCLLLFQIGKKLFDEYVGTAALWIYALYGPAVFYIALLDKTTFSNFLICATLLSLTCMFVRQRLQDALIAGLLLGITTLTRGNMLATIPFIALGYLRTSPADLSFRDKIRHLSVFACATMAIVSLVTIRNYAVSGDRVLLTANSGLNIFIGNNRNAIGTYKLPNFISGTPAREFTDSKHFAEGIARKRLTRASEVSSFYFSEAMRFITQHPSAWIRLLWTKLTLAAKYLEILDTYSFDFFRSESTVLKLCFLSYGFLCPAGILGFLLLSKDRRVLPITTFAAGYLASLLLIFVTGRYRMPLVLSFTLFAAGGGAALIAESRAGNKHRLGYALAALLLLALFTNTDTRHMREKIIPLTAASPHTIVGALYNKEGNYARAVSHLERAAALKPDDPFTWAHLADLHEKRGAYQQALDSYLRALNLFPDFDEAYNNIGLIYARLGDRGRAREAFKNAYRLRPENPVYKRNYERLSALTR